MGEIIIIGSGISGHRAAAELHRLAPDKVVQVIGTELGRPYDRPPLSKEYLLKPEPVRPSLGQSEIYDSGVGLRDGDTVTSIDREDRSVILSSGARLRYEALLLATGSRLRRLPLPAVDPRRIFYLRTLDDADRLRAALVGRPRVTIIGGGFVGLEVAAAARHHGCAVTVLEMAPMLLSRSATPALAAYVRRLHERRDVNVVLGARLREVFEDRDGITLCWDGGQVGADMVVVGIGVVPNVELAATSGLSTADGIVVDHACRTSDAAIFAAGEATTHPIGRLSLSARTESWSAASAQAVVAARNMVGMESSLDELPWFWSDQHDVNIQCLGLPNAANHFFQLGDPAGDSWMRIGTDEDGRLIGAEAVNMGREVSALRRADRGGQPIPPWILDQAVGVEATTPGLASAHKDMHLQ